ncbi:MAG: trigger factor, partial [Desulfovibrio sp.]|nr:trigger factor [Desulfovibrio sp.]
TGAAALYKDSVSLAGFRKGKVPLRIIEQRYHDAIYQEACTNLTNVHIANIIEEKTVEIVGGLQVTPNNKFTRDEDYSYSIEFDTLPQFELPNYEGLEVEVEKEQLPEAPSLEELLERVREKAATFVTLEDADHVSDGQFANVDFTFTDPNGELKEFSEKNFLVQMGAKESLAAFEALVKSVKLGEEKSDEITFPADFLIKEYQGKTMQAKVRLNAIKVKKYPELNDEFAKAQNYASLDSMKHALRIGQEKQYEAFVKSAVQNKMVDSLLKMVDFPLPPSLVRSQQEDIISEIVLAQERKGKAAQNLWQDEELLKRVLPRAEYYVRSTILLRSIAKKEGLQVSDKEVSDYLMNEAHRVGYDYNTLRKVVEANGRIFMIRDRIWADKGADLIFARGKYTIVEKAPQADKEQAAAASEKAAETETTQA